MSSYLEQFAQRYHFYGKTYETILQQILSLEEPVLILNRFWIFPSPLAEIWINASKKFFIDNGHLRCLMLVSHKRKFTENLVNKFRAFER